MVARGLFGTQPHGVYVDIGAHHPVLASNTYHFYHRGWRGINVDAMPGSMRPFRVLRPHDTNLEICLSDKPDGEITFYVFGERSPLNTADPKMAVEHEKKFGTPVIEKRVMYSKTLAQVLAQHLPSVEIDLLSIDVEGMDEAILRSNDWAKYRPKVIIFERHQARPAAIVQDELVRFLSDQGYELCGMTGPSYLMRRCDWSPV